MQSRLPPQPPPTVLRRALLGSLLMFAGWVLAIVPSFQHLNQVWLVTALVVVFFGLVLIPSGLDFFFWSAPADSTSKRGVGVIVWSMLPALALMVIAISVLPTPLVTRILAIVTELVGMGLFGWAWWTYRAPRHPPDRALPGAKRVRPAS